MKYVVYFAIVWCVMCGPGNVAFAYTGDVLLEACQILLELADDRPVQGVESPKMKAAVCVGYVRGVVDGMAMGKPKYYCLPAELNWTQAVRVIVKYLKGNPAVTMDSNASGNIVIALMDAFPCPEAK